MSAEENAALEGEPRRKTQRVRILRGVVAGGENRVAGEVCDLSLSDAFTLCGSPSGPGAGFVACGERVDADTPLGKPQSQPQAKPEPKRGR